MKGDVVGMLTRPALFEAGVEVKKWIDSVQDGV